MSKVTVLLSCCALAISACSKRDPAAAERTAAGETPVPNLATRITDPCALLTADEVARIFEGPIKQAKQGETKDEGGLSVTQCLYELSTGITSINLRVVQRGAGEQARDPRDVWTETFAAEKLQEAGRRAPQPVPGIGDQAFWRTHRKGAALYVLKGSAYIWLAVDGTDESGMKQQKCVDAARLVIERLQSF
jgi:hypothetical protein